MLQVLETSQKLKEQLMAPAGLNTPVLDYMESAGHRYVKDLKVNVGNVLASEHLSLKEAALLALSVAVNNKNAGLTEAFKALSAEKGANELEIAEAMACAGLLAANNVFYRFRHFMQKERYEQLPARIKMNTMMNPVLGKEFFELASLAVSAVNGCEMCVKAHEHSLLQLGASEERVWDAVRLAAVVAGLDRSL